MERVYLDILQEWEDRVADPAVYEHLDVLFPSFQFRRLYPGDPKKDHWASRYKLDLSLPRYKNAEKTVVYRSDMRFREQGDWDNGIGVIDRFISDQGLTNVFEAYVAISSRLGLAMPQAGDREVTEAVDRQARRSALMDTLVDYFCWNLENNKSAKASATRSYLKRRGFTPKQSSHLLLGFVPDWSKVIRYITIDKHFPLEDLNEVCGVLNADNYTAVGKTHVLAIPYECGGVVKGFLFRRIDDSREGPKYLANANLDRKTVFFNIPAASDLEDIIVVEGEMDALKASAEGIRGVVAIGGSEVAGERRRQIEDALRRGVKRITLCLDLDAKKDSGEPNYAARHDHIMKSVHTIKDVDPSFEEIYVACFSEPSDPDEYIRERGGEAFRELLGNAVPYWCYLFEYKEGKR